ncbi:MULTISPECIES: hypothetical protein [unclassified Anabaena]|uniref:hypothetical protein n=1 Tax=unclassified Anabaena TaxID=2619674 RepID=UPI0014477131|nr:MULTISPECIES: hypothetical protein [unclassified Anabaena]
MQLIDISFTEKDTEIYTGGFFVDSEPQNIYTLEDLVWILEQLSQYLELSNAC